MASRLRASLRGYITKNPAQRGLAKAKPKPKPAAKSVAPVAPLAPATAVPVTPAAPAAPAPTPWDTNYETRVGAINRTRDDSLAGIQDDANRAKQEYGFDDPSDPFNRLKQMERFYQQSKAGSLNSNAASGRLYNGSTQLAQDQLGYGESKDRDALRRSYDDVLGGLQQRRLAVKTGAEEDIAQADYDRVLAALENRPEPAVAAAKPKPKKKPSQWDAITAAWGIPGAKKSEFDGKTTRAERKAAKKKAQKARKGKK